MTVVRHICLRARFQSPTGNVSFYMLKIGSLRTAGAACNLSGSQNAF